MTFLTVDDFVTGSNIVTKVPMGPDPPPYWYLDCADQAIIDPFGKLATAAGTRGTSKGPSVILGTVGRQQQS